MIAFTQLSDSSQCNYVDLSSSNPHLSGIVKVRNAIGLAENRNLGKDVTANVY